MNWLEVSIETLSGAGVELLTATLMEAGILGIETVDDYEMRLFLENNPDAWDYADEKILTAERGAAVLRFYLTEDDGETLAAVKAALGRLKAPDTGHNLGSLGIATRIVDDEDWANNWKQYFKPFKIPPFVIRPEWESYEALPGDVVLAINPGQVFGTGQHQSTRMCLEALSHMDLSGMNVLDLGCGSGILAIGALLLGAARAVAVDTDPLAARVVAENAALNGVEARLAIHHGNIINDKRLLERISAGYDVILANIVADVVVNMTPLAAGLLSKNGRYISSGIIAGRVGDVEACLGANGFRVLDIMRLDEWACIVAGAGGV